MDLIKYFSKFDNTTKFVLMDEQDREDENVQDKEIISITNNPLTSFGQLSLLLTDAGYIMGEPVILPKDHGIKIQYFEKDYNSCSEPLGSLYILIFTED